MTSAKYLQTLKDSIMAQLRKHSAFRTVIWQQNGAPLLHYDQKIVRDYLDDIFFYNGLVVEKLEWAALSPALTPCDFSLWGIIKDCVYVQQLRDVNHLIEREFKSLDNYIELCQTISRSVTDHCQMCISIEGKQSEHLL